jgi:hypothetical protein
MPSQIWSNWHETVSQRVRRFEVLKNPDPTQSTVAGYNATTKQVQSLIGAAVSGGMSVRAYGGGWSFTPIAVTDGIMIATQHLNYRFALDAGQVHPPYAAGRLPVLVQCGMSIADLNRYLATRGQCIPTSGASNGQTIAGALSTGTHGAAVGFGAIPEYVKAIHIATGPDTTVWLERATYRVVRDNVIAAFGATLIADDDVFNAALVGVGCFGIVLGVVIEARPSYVLTGWRSEYQLTQAHWDAIQRLDFAGMDLPLDAVAPYHLELLQNVLDNGRTLITTLYDLDPPTGGPMPSDSSLGVGDSALDVIAAITNMLGGAPWGSPKLLGLKYKPYSKISGTPAQYFKDTTTRGMVASTAVGVPISHAQHAFDIATAAVATYRAPAIVSMRFVKATAATLGFTMHEPVTAVTEIDGSHATATLAAQSMMWRGIRAARIPNAFHWGKLNDIDAQNLRASYGERVDRWVRARQQIITPELRKVFSNSFAERLGITD